MSGETAPQPEGQRTTALKQKLHALRRSRSGAGRRSGGDDVLREWRQSRASNSVSPVDWDALDAADQISATPADAVGSDAARLGGGDSGSDTGAAEAPSSTQELSFEERVARVLAASAAVLRRVPQQSGDAVVAHTTAGVLSPTNTGRGAGGQSTSAASRTSEDDSDGDVLARWRRQRRAESTSLGWAAPPAALAVAAAEDATAAAQRATDNAASLIATPPRRAADTTQHASASTLLPQDTSHQDETHPLPRRTPASGARRALTLDGSPPIRSPLGDDPSAASATALRHMPPTRSRRGEPAWGDKPGDSDWLEAAVASRLLGDANGDLSPRPRIHDDFMMSDDVAQLLQFTVENMLFGSSAPLQQPAGAMRPAHDATAPSAAVLSPTQALRSPVRAETTPSRQMASAALIGQSTPPRGPSSPPASSSAYSAPGVVMPLPVRTPSPVRLSPSATGSPVGDSDEIVATLKARIAACRHELAQLGTL